MEENGKKERNKIRKTQREKQIVQKMNQHLKRNRLKKRKTGHTYNSPIFLGGKWGWDINIRNYNWFQNKNIIIKIIKISHGGKWNNICAPTPQFCCILYETSIKRMVFKKTRGKTKHSPIVRFFLHLYQFWSNLANYFSTWSEMSL